MPNWTIRRPVFKKQIPYNKGYNLQEKKYYKYFYKKKKYYKYLVNNIKSDF